MTNFNLKMSTDQEFLEGIVLRRYQKIISSNITTTGAEEPWVVVERLFTTLLPISTNRALLGLHSEGSGYGRLDWVRRVNGCLRIVDRDRKGTRFAVCLPSNALEIMSQLEKDKRYVAELAVASYLHVQVQGQWSLTYTLTSLAGTPLMTGTEHDPVLSKCAMRVMDTVAQKLDRAVSAPAQVVRQVADWRINTKPYQFIAFIGFLVHTYWLGTHTFLSFHNAAVLLSWIAAIILLKVVDKE